MKNLVINFVFGVEAWGSESFTVTSQLSLKESGDTWAAKFFTFRSASQQGK